MSHCQLCAQESERVTDDIRGSSGFARGAHSSAVNRAETEESRLSLRRTYV